MASSTTGKWADFQIGDNTYSVNMASVTDPQSESSHYFDQLVADIDIMLKYLRERGLAIPTATAEKVSLLMQVRNARNLEEYGSEPSPQQPVDPSRKRRVLDLSDDAPAQAAPAGPDIIDIRDIYSG